VFWIVQHSKLHTLENKFVFQIIEFGNNNFRIFENIGVREKIIEVQKEIYRFLKYPSQLARIWPVWTTSYVKHT